MINPSSPIPLHIQLRKIIEKKIQQGYFKEKIPSERELMEEYDVSRSTVREAISQLVIDGIVEKVHGKGTFISKKPIHFWSGNLMSTTDIIKSMGMKPSTKLIENRRITVSGELKEAINLVEAYLIKRIRFADGIPLAVETQYYPIEIGEQLAKLDINEGTLYDLLENVLNIELHDSEEIVTSNVPTPEDAKLLNLEKGQSTLQLERFVYDVDVNLIEYCISDYNPNMYSLHFRSKRIRK